MARQTTNPILIVLAVMVFAALAATVVLSIGQGHQITRNKDQITRNKETIAELERLDLAQCRAANFEHRIISDALVASLTEEDVQANAPQREAYEEIVRQFREPIDCTR